LRSRIRSRIIASNYEFSTLQEEKSSAKNAALQELIANLTRLLANEDERLGTEQEPSADIIQVEWIKWSCKLYLEGKVQLDLIS
jgi:hypothetical protein